MDPVRNPYAPGAGQRPPELAGRDAELQAFDVLLERVGRGRPERSVVLTGLRGVGKTVLLNALRSSAVRRGWGTGKLEIRPDRSLRQPLAAALHPAIRELGAPASESGHLLGILKAFAQSEPAAARSGRGAGSARGRGTGEPVASRHRRAHRSRTGRLRRYRDRPGRAVHRSGRPGRRHRQGHRDLHRRAAGSRAGRRVGPVRGLPRDRATRIAACRGRGRVAASAGCAVGEQVVLRAAVPLHPDRAP